MHVLVLPSWYPTAEQPEQGVYLREQARALQAGGLRCGVIYPEQRSLRQLSWRALQANRFQMRWHDEGGLPTLRRHDWNLLWRSDRRFDVLLHAAAQLYDRYAARRGAPDLIHAHSAQWAAGAAARLSAQHGVPYLVTEHFSGFHRGALSTRQFQLAARGLGQARRVLTVSRSLRRTLLRQQLVAPDRVEVLPNSVDTQFFTLPPQPRSQPPFTFFALASLEARKGIDVLLRGFARAFGRRPDIQLEIGGEGPERGRLERLARRLGLGSQVDFRGRLSREEVRAACWRANAFVLPSRYETFGVALIEAMATGLPVVATHCGGPADIVTPETGLLVPPESPGALADGMKKLLEARSRFDGNPIRRYITVTFAASHITDRLLTHYRDILTP